MKDHELRKKVEYLYDYLSLSYSYPDSYSDRFFDRGGTLVESNRKQHRLTEDKMDMLLDYLGLEVKRSGECIVKKKGKHEKH